MISAAYVTRFSIARLSTQPVQRLDCGLELGRWLSPGDVVELEIEKIGILRNRVVREAKANT